MDRQGGLTSTLPRFRTCKQTAEKIYSINSRASYSTGAGAITDSTGRSFIFNVVDIHTDWRSVVLPAPRGPATPILPPDILSNSRRSFLFDSVGISYDGSNTSASPGAVNWDCIVS